MVKRTIELNGETYFFCLNDGEVVRNIDDHKCPHALIAECFSLRCGGKTTDLDSYGNCVQCGSVLVTDRRAKFTHAEVVKSYLDNELGSVVGESLARVAPIAHIRKLAVRWYTAVRNRLPNFNMETYGHGY